jgi:hypothetical protein
MSKIASLDNFLYPEDKDFGLEELDGDVEELDLNAIIQQHTDQPM